MTPTEDTPISESQHSDTQNTNVYQNKQDDTLNECKENPHGWHMLDEDGQCVHCGEWP